MLDKVASIFLKLTKSWNRGV